MGYLNEKHLRGQIKMQRYQNDSSKGRSDVLSILNEASQRFDGVNAVNLKLNFQGKAPASEYGNTHKLIA